VIRLVLWHNFDSIFFFGGFWCKDPLTGQHRLLLVLQHRLFRTLHTVTNNTQIALSNKKFDRVAFDDLLKRRCFFIQSFEIYSGVKGLYDYGPPGCAIKTNFLSLWRQFFLLEENILEIECTALTPEIVLMASGHVEKFTDLMVRDEKTGECYRADHLFKEHIDKLLERKDLTAAERQCLEQDRLRCDTAGAEELGELLEKYHVKSPDGGNPISKPFPFNLMFQTQIGATGKQKGYLRPETAQGMFVNFKRLLEYNAGRLPFAAAQIGPAFRNEIAPRSGLLRLREFTLAEIEHFVLPDQKKHPKFNNVKDTRIRFFPRENQLNNGEMIVTTIGEMVAKKVVDNETLGYFIARVHLFLLKVGIHEDRLRFRQHLRTEMAHYAADCWDAEVNCSYGWIEVVGIADRACYDLTQHSKWSKETLAAFVEYPDGPRTVEEFEMEIDKKTIGQKFKNEAKNVFAHLEAIQKDQNDVVSFQKELETKGVVKIENCELTRDHIKFKKVTKRKGGENVIPHVIEPAFGVGRIIYCILEHSYYTREGDEKRAVLALKPIIAPVKCSVFPLTADPAYTPLVSKIARSLTDLSISNKVDESGASIGKRYARTDELGIPFAITLDPDTLKDFTVTLRERDSTNQIRVKMDEIASLVLKLTNEEMTWEEALAKYPHFTPVAE
jgi:glycyl-tRNA synthetase